MCPSTCRMGQLWDLSAKMEREKIGVVYDGNNFPANWTTKQLAKITAGFYTQWDNVLFQKYVENFNLPTNQKIRHYYNCSNSHWK